MSTAETLPQASREQHDSLSSEKNFEAIELYKDYMHAQQNRFLGRNQRKYNPTYTSGIFRPFDAAIEIGKVHNSIGRAKHHYHENRHAYHAQAVKDAERAGVEINFNGDEAKNVKHSRED